MNKTLLIGVPVILVALIAVYMVMRPSSTDDLNAPKVAALPPAAAPAVTPPAPVAVIPVAPAPAKPTLNVGNVDTSSVDSISAGFLADATADTTAISGDTTDKTAVNAELANYDTVKSTSYDIAI